MTNPEESADTSIQNQSSGKKFSPLRVAARTVAILVTVYILYALGSFFAVPYFGKKAIEDNLTEFLQRKTTVEEVYFNPLTLHARVSGLAIERANGNGSLLSLHSIETQPSISSIPNLAPVISELRINGLKINLTFLGKGKYNISDIIKKGLGADNATQQKPQNDEKPFPFALHSFELSNSTIVFADTPQDRVHRIEDITIRVPFASSFEDHLDQPVAPEFSARINNNAISFSGSFSPFASKPEAEFKLGTVQLELPQYWHYLPISTSLNLESGHVSTSISLFVRRNEKQGVVFSLGGQGNVSQVLLSEPDQGRILAFERAAFDLKELSLLRKVVHFSSLELLSPYVRTIRGDSGVNWNGYYKGKSNIDFNEYIPAAFAKPERSTNRTNGSVAQEEAAPFIIVADNAAIRNATFEFQDLAIPRGFQHTFGPMNVLASGISTAGGGNASLSLNMGGGNGHVDVRADMVSLATDGILRCTVTNLNTRLFKSYIDEFAPLHLDSTIVNAQAVASLANGTVTLDDLDAVLSDVGLLQPGRKKPSIRTRELKVTDARINPQQKEILIQGVALNDPELTLNWLEDGSFDLVKTLAGTSKSDSREDSAGNDEKAWTISLDTAAVNNGKVTVNDESMPRKGSLNVSSINVSVSDLVLPNGQNTSCTFEMNTPQSGRLAGTCGITLSPLQLAGNFAVKQMNLSSLDPILDRFMDATITAGLFSANGQFRHDEKNGQKISADTIISGFDLINGRNREKLVQFASLAINGIAFEPQSLIVKEVRLADPVVRVSLNEDKSLNLAQAFVSSTRTKTAPAADEGKNDMTMDIGLVKISNGLVEFSDKTVQPTFRTALRELDLTLTGLGTAEDSMADMDMVAKVGHAPLKASGKLRPLTRKMFADITLGLTGLELPPLSPYTLRDTAYPIADGSLYAELNYKLDDRLLSIDNDILIKRMELGKKDTRPDAPSVPIQLGLALLTDPAGNINLSLPVKGNLDDPEFSVGGIVFKAFLNLIFKAVASPFSLLASLLPEGSEQLEYVMFDPGSAQLPKQAVEKLKTLSTALVQRPGIGIAVDGVFDSGVDTKGLARVQLDTMLKRRKLGLAPGTPVGRSVTLTTSERHALLKELYTEKIAAIAEKTAATANATADSAAALPAPEVMENKLLETISIDPSALRTLASDRARAVQDHLLFTTRELEGRVTIRNTEDDRTQTGLPGNRADLAIE